MPYSTFNVTYFPVRKRIALMRISVGIWLVFMTLITAAPPLWAQDSTYRLPSPPAYAAQAQRQAQNAYHNRQWPYRISHLLRSEQTIWQMESLGYNPDLIGQNQDGLASNEEGQNSAPAPAKHLSPFSHIPSSADLNNDLWLGMDRDFVTLSLQSILHYVQNTPPLNQARRDAYINLLTAPSRSDLLSPAASKPDAGFDLLTMRLQILNSLMAYDQAANMYRQLHDMPYHPNLMLQGITAFLGAGEYEEACIEIWSAAPYVQDDMPFWDDLTLFCQQNFAPKDLADSIEFVTNNKDQASQPQWQDFADMPLAQLIVLNKMKRIGPILNKIYAQDIPSGPIARFSLAKNEILRPYIKAKTPFEYGLPIMISAYRLKLVDLKGLKRFYQRHDKSLYNAFITSEEQSKRLDILTQIISPDTENGQSPFPADLRIDAIHPFLDVSNNILLEKLPAPILANYLSAGIGYSSLHNTRHWTLSQMADDFIQAQFLIHAPLLAIESDQAPSPKKTSSQEKDESSVLYLDDSAISFFGSYIAYQKRIHSDISDNIISFLKKLNISLKNNNKNNAQQVKTTKNAAKILFLSQRLLDIDTEKAHISFGVYEKRTDLTLPVNYVIKSFSINQQIKDALLRQSKSQLLFLWLLILSHPEYGSENNAELNTDFIAIYDAIFDTAGVVGLVDQGYNILKEPLFQL